MSDRPTLAAASRTVTGKAVARLRHEGRLPAVVYGHSTASESVSVDAHEFDLLRRHTSATTLVDLAVDGGKARPVLIHGIQVHPVNRRPIHVDLLAVRMTEALTIDVGLVGTGHAPAVEMGGTVNQPIESVRVRALPGDLPESIHFDLASLDTFEATITVADLVAPDGVTILTEPTEVIARVLPPRVEEPTAAEAEAAEAAEGEGEAASASGEGGSTEDGSEG